MGEDGTSEGQAPAISTDVLCSSAPCTSGMSVGPRRELGRPLTVPEPTQPAVHSR